MTSSAQPPTPLALPRNQSKEFPGIKLELAVKMHCKSCEREVRSIIEKTPGVRSLEIDLERESVYVTGEADMSIEGVLHELRQRGRLANVVGVSSELADGGAHRATGGLLPAAVVVPEEMGTVEDGAATAVVEFKGPTYNHGSIFGVVRLIQLTGEASTMQGELYGLEPSTPYTLCVHASGDVRSVQHVGKPIHELARGSSDAGGRWILSSSLAPLPFCVWDVIGRSLVVGKRDGREPTRLAASVIARSSPFGGNAKRACTCDGKTIFDYSTPPEAGPR